MNLFTKIAAIIYKSYDEKGVGIPHFRTITTIVFILFMHIVQIGLVFRISSNYLMPWSSTSNKGTQWFYAFLYFAIFIGIILFFFSKKKLDKVELTRKQIDRGKIILPIYFTVCFLFVIILLIRSGVEQGKISH